MSKKDNPMRVNMRDVIFKQLSESYGDDNVDMDHFSDISASCINIKERVEETVITTTLSFDYEGDIITDIKVFVGDIVETVENEKTLKSLLRKQQ